MTEGQGWVAIAWLGVIAMAVADSAWGAVVSFVVFLVAGVITLLVLRKVWP